MELFSQFQVLSKRSTFIYISALMLLSGILAACQPQTGSFALAVPPEGEEVLAEGQPPDSAHHV